MVEIHQFLLAVLDRPGDRTPEPVGLFVTNLPTMLANIMPR